MMIAIALAAAAPASPALLGPSDIVNASVLPPPPAKGSAQERAELSELTAMERTRTAADVASAKIDGATKNASIFGSAIGPRFQLDHLPQTALLMAMVRSSEKAAADRAKIYFRRPRPWIVNPSIGSCSRNDDALSSYPSGHTTMAFSMGAILGRLIPDHAPAILARAARYGESRLVCEVHYRSDITAGVALGLVVAERLMAKPAFEVQFRRSQAELARSGIIPVREVAIARNPNERRAGH